MGNNITDTNQGLNKMIRAMDVLIKQQIATKKALEGTTKTMSAQTKTVEKTSKSVKEIVDNYYSLADAQDAVNETSRTFTRRFAEASQGTGKASKAWTMFSRVLSGSPLWKLQNYVRSVGQAMDFFYTRTEEATKAANKQAQSMGTLTANIEQVEEQLKLMGKAGNHKELIESNLEYKNTFEALLAAGMKQKEAEKTALARTQNMYDATLEKLKDNLKKEGEALMAATKNEQFIKAKARINELKQSKDAEDKKRLQALKAFSKLQTDMEKLKKARDKIEKKFGPMGPEVAEANRVIASQRGKMGALAKESGFGKGEISDLAKAQKKIFDNSLMVRLARFGKDFMTFKPLFSAVSGIRKLTMKNAQGIRPITKFVGIAKKVAILALQYSMYFILFLVGALLAFVFIKKLFEKAEVMNVLMETLSGVFEGIKEMFGGAILIFEAFFGGGTLGERFTKLFKGIFSLYKGLYKIIFSVIIGAGKLLIKLTVAYIVFVIETYVKIFKLFFTKDGREMLRNFIVKALEKVGVFFSGIIPKTRAVLEDLWNRLFTWIETNVVDPIKNALDFDFFNTGGVSSGGMAIVGERGPELVNLPAGSRVRSNDTTKSMMGGSVTNNISVNVNGRLGASDGELRDIAKKIGRMVSTEINRTTSSSTNVRF